ncbi:MAG: hypothetical protein ABFS38_07645 [Bacteroidota bacterium]
MKMKSILLDFVFIIVLTALLIILSETGNLDSLIKLPFITIYTAYIIGRFAGYLSHKSRASK